MVRRFSDLRDSALPGVVVRLQTACKMSRVRRQQPIMKDGVSFTTNSLMEVDRGCSVCLSQISFWLGRWAVSTEWQAPS